MNHLINIYFGILIFMTGTIMGSFLGCMAQRCVKGENFGIKTRSHCDSCGHVLSAGDLIPIISFLLGRGRCRYCGSKIGLRVFLVEVITGFGFLGIFLKYDFSLEMLKSIVITSCLICAALIDLDTLMVPNAFFVLLFLIWVCLIPFESDIPAYLCNSMGGCLIAPVFILLISKLIFLIKNKDGIGGGDIKLLFSLGLFFGISRSIFNIIVMCFYGLIIAFVSRKKTGEAFAFVPAIALSSYTTLLFGKEIIQLYFKLIGMEVSLI